MCRVRRPPPHPADARTADRAAPIGARDARWCWRRPLASSTRTVASTSVTVLFATHAAYLDHLAGPAPPRAARAARTQCSRGATRAGLERRAGAGRSGGGHPRGSRACAPGAVPRSHRGHLRHRRWPARPRHLRQRGIVERSGVGRRCRPHRGASAARRSRRCRVLRGASPGPPRHHHRVDGVLLRQQRRRRGRVAGCRGRARAGVRLRRAPRQRHARHLLRRPAGAVRQHPPVAAVSRHGPARRSGRGRRPRLHDEHSGAAGRHGRRLPPCVR